MKRTIFVVFTMVAIVAMMSGAAFAADRYNAVYLDPTAGASPHGTYSTATNKCAVCHAVHNPGGISALSAADKNIDATRDGALGGSEILLRDDAANACSYCHVSNNFAIKTVYAETPSNYTDNTLSNAHNTNGAAMDNDGVNCTNCHQVHGASDMMASTDLYMVRKILKFDGGNVDDDAPAIAANADNTTADQSNMSTYCSQCHRYYEDGYNGDSHVMGAAGAYNNGSATVSGVVAWAPSTYCRSCHQDGVTNQAAGTNGVNNYPHFVGGYRFLRQANSDNVADAPSAGMNDGNCTICHAGDDGSGSNTIGVGVSF